MPDRLCSPQSQHQPRFVFWTLHLHLHLRVVAKEGRKDLVALEPTFMQLCIDCTEGYVADGHFISSSSPTQSPIFLFRPYRFLTNSVVHKRAMTSRQHWLLVILHFDHHLSASAVRKLLRRPHQCPKCTSALL